MSSEPDPEWCITATMLPYPYDVKPHRSHGVFPAGAKLYVVGGFAGMGYETVSVVGYPHHGRKPVLVHLPARYLGGWRTTLVYRPVLLRRMHKAEEEAPRTCHRFSRIVPDGHPGRTDRSNPEYGEELAKVAGRFQRHAHGDPLGTSPDGD